MRGKVHEGNRAACVRDACCIGAAQTTKRNTFARDKTVKMCASKHWRRADLRGGAGHLAEAAGGRHGRERRAPGPRTAGQGAASARRGRGDGAVRALPRSAGMRAGDGQARPCNQAHIKRRAVGGGALNRGHNRTKARHHLPSPRPPEHPSARCAHPDRRAPAAANESK